MTVPCFYVRSRYEVYRVQYGWLIKLADKHIMIIAVDYYYIILNSIRLYTVNLREMQRVLHLALGEGEMTRYCCRSPVVVPTG